MLGPASLLVDAALEHVLQHTLQRWPVAGAEAIAYGQGLLGVQHRHDAHHRLAVVREHRVEQQHQPAVALRATVVKDVAEGVEAASVLEARVVIEGGHAPAWVSMSRQACHICLS